jgi:hypothetical protein
MKLYATTTSRTTSKGVGSDTMLTIQLNYGNKRVADLLYTVCNNKPWLDIRKNSDKIEKIDLEK